MSQTYMDTYCMHAYLPYYLRYVCMYLQYTYTTADEPYNGIFVAVCLLSNDMTRMDINA